MSKIKNKIKTAFVLAKKAWQEKLELFNKNNERIAKQDKEIARLTAENKNLTRQISRPSTTTAFFRIEQALDRRTTKFALQMEVADMEIRMCKDDIGIGTLIDCVMQQMVHPMRDSIYKHLCVINGYSSHAKEEYFLKYGIRFVEMSLPEPVMRIDKGRDRLRW